MERTVGVVGKSPEALILEAILGHPLRGFSPEALQEEIGNLLPTLRWREREVFKVRYVIPAITGGKKPTFAEVGSIFKITRERVRQIETKALKKLFDPAGMQQSTAKHDPMQRIEGFPEPP